MKKQLLLSTVLAAALAAGSAHAAGSGYGSQSTDAQMDRTQGMEQTQEQTGQMGASPGQAASGEQGYDPSRAGVGGVSADQTAQITNNTDAVRQIQQALQEKGQDIQVDGIWGPNTQQALRDFQEQQGQTQATGELNQETLQALDVELSQMQPQTAETPTDMPMGSGMGSGMGQDRMESAPGMGSEGMGSEGVGSEGAGSSPSR
ncbi:MAG: hypothetical protein VR70_14165 [Rhodospirillaceae bacterium BRH_c57]|nr:MAG: hypothetical protein VR70_14165 [Rhodospirillaceae bacterium BRH_c57]